MMAYTGTPTVAGGYLATANGESIQLDTSAWFAWLETAVSFSYASQRLGSYRLHLRKRKRRSRSYWYAHLKIAAKLYNSYAGSSAQLTAAHLDEVGLRLLDKKRSSAIDTSTA
jgi:hypothetical protein